MKRVSRLFAVIILSLPFFACSAINDVAAWQKGNLAKPVMNPYPSKHQLAVEVHTATSKEASQTGYGLGAGGCGCN